MKVQIRQRGVDLAESLRADVKRRLALALGRFGNEIERVIVSFSTSSDQRFGSNHCELEVKLQPQSLMAADWDSDPLAAADHAIDKVVRIVTRTLQRDDAGPVAPARSVRRVGKPAPRAAPPKRRKKD